MKGSVTEFTENLTHNQVAICGEDSGKLGRAIQHLYLPNKILALSNHPTSLPLLMKERFINGETMIYVCVNNACQSPVKTVDQAVEIIRTSFNS